ncbi:hypothetical protein ANN_19924 [Periplaneta americana]|uniref:Uncharacterized protein n=1 Tax=Periplaneta americana TaxID=6978 RepID=A0ABQ8SBK6_PERAM|nr:hypothetical protein ANN_19924 [Periplaneta americana]
MAGLFEGGNEPPGSLTAMPVCRAPWRRGLRHPVSDWRYGMGAGSSPHGGRYFLMKFGQRMGPVPTQHRDAFGELR